METTTKVEKPVETKVEKPVKKTITKTVPNLDLMYQTISNLTNVVTALESDIKRIKVRMGIQTVSKVGEYYRELDEMFGPNEYSGPEEDPISNCCGAQFGYPGWPDSDLCAECGEHADLYDEVDKWQSRPPTQDLEQI